MLTPIQLYRELGRLVSPFIKHYRTDLTKHDKAWILENPDVPFCHWTSESSTHLVPMFNHDSPKFPAEGLQVRYLFSTASRWHIIEQTKLVAEVLSSKNQFNSQLVLHFDGYVLREVSSNRAEQIVAEYVAEVRAAWTPKPKPKVDGSRGFTEWELRYSQAA